MKSIIILLFVIFLVPVLPANAQEKQITVPYTLTDRDRAVRTEAKLEALEIKISALETKSDAKFESLQKQIDQLFSLFYWGFGILITLFLFNLGYTIWDRRTALKPALLKSEAADEKSNKLIRVIRDYAKDHPDLENILRMNGLL